MVELHARRFVSHFLPSTGVDRRVTRRHTAWWMRAPPPSSRPQRLAPVPALGWALAASQVQQLGETGCCTACPESQDLSDTKYPPWIEPWPLSRCRVAVPFCLVAWGMGHARGFGYLMLGLHTLHSVKCRGVFAREFGRPMRVLFFTRTGNLSVGPACSLCTATVTFRGPLSRCCVVTCCNHTPPCAPEHPTPRAGWVDW